MNTLRVKLAVLIAVAIISVVGAVIAARVYLLGLPDERQAIGPMVSQVELLEQVRRATPSLLSIQPKPADGWVDADLTSWLREALAARGTPRDVLVSRTDSRDLSMLSIPTEGGWLVTQLTDLPPPGGVFNMIMMFFAFIALGAIAIAVFFANRMVKPLVLLEKAIESVGPDALLPELPVSGPAEVRVAAKALNSLSSRLKAAMESRMRLVAAAGHDLRTPITRMRLRAEFVENADDRAMWLKDIDELARIADSAIELVREESGKSKPEYVKLDRLIADLTSDLSAMSYDVTLTCNAAAVVRADRVGLNRAFRNLIINAATHGKRARIDIDVTPADVTVTIDDDGPGIPPELLDRVFEPFFRVHPARTKEIDGTGLGLTIAHEIVQHAGGSLVIENGALRGLVQIVRIPVAPGPEVA